MKLFKIGSDYFNLDYLLRVKANSNDSATLYFSDRTETKTGTSVTITKKNWENILRQLETEFIGSADNDYTRSAGSETFKIVR